MITFRQSPDYPTGGGPVILVSPEKFVVRTIPLSGAGDLTEQVELAVESSAPLPLSQLYWGYLVAPDRRSALIWVACRRHFFRDETVLWNDAAAVLPGFLLLSQAPEQRPAIVLHDDGASVQGVAWDEASPLPLLVLTRAIIRETQPATAELLLQEIRRRTGFETVAVTCLTGSISVAPAPDRKGMVIQSENQSATYRWTELATADIRDQSTLADIRRQRRRSSLQWGATAAAAAVAIAAAGVDLASLAGSWWLKGREADAIRQAVTVNEIQSTHVLAHRLEELAGQRIQFMEMLDLLNEKRPAGLLFARVASTGPRSLEISIRTPNADDARQYETALRAMPELRVVQVSNLQTRDGHTDFLLMTEFRPEAMPTGARIL